MLIAGGSESMSRAPFVMAKATSRLRPQRRDVRHHDRLALRQSEDESALMATTRCRATAENVAAGLPGQPRRPGRLRRAQPGKGRRARRPTAASPPRSSRSRFRSARATRSSWTRDEHPRETSVEALGKLRPIVRPDGTVTAGNASGVNDGAAALIVATEEAAKRNGLTPRARVLGAAVAGVPPRIMGIGPAPATEKLLKRLGLDDRRHGRDRAQRGLRRPGPRRAAPARPRRRRRPA